MNKHISHFLDAHEWTDGTLNYNEARGFLFAIASAPDLIRPSEWLPVIINELDPHKVSPREAQAVIKGLIELYNQVNQAVALGKVALPEDISIRTPALENVGDAAALGQWSRGFFLAHDWIVELWHHNTPMTQDKELGSCLMVLSFFSSRELAEAYYWQASQFSDGSMEEFAQDLLEMFENAMSRYARLGRSLQEAQNSEETALKDPFESELVGRDDPCPCGSGKKFKACCLH